jgi:putative Holliday junction resolvase
MQILELRSLLAALPPRCRLLGLDVGTHTIGLATSDFTYMIATPLEIITRTKIAKDSTALQAVIAREQVGGLVVGWPVNMDGSEGPRCQSTKQFLQNIAAQITLPVVLWDERLSTAAVTRTMLEADLSRARRKELVDKMAATYILQGALDALQYAHRNVNR